MFTKTDFDVFDIPDLTGRLAAVKSVLDPKFEQLAPAIQAALSSDEMQAYVHIAQHLRRHKNPPPNTWVAFSESKRGYKMTPHIELGFWDDRLFLWLAGLAELRDRPAFITTMMAAPGMVNLFDQPNWQLCGNHTQKPVMPLTETNYDQLLGRYNQVAKAEFLVGRIWLKGDPIFDQPDQLQQQIVETVTKLAEPYQKLNAK